MIVLKSLGSAARRRPISQYSVWLSAADTVTRLLCVHVTPFDMKNMTRGVVTYAVLILLTQGPCLFKFLNQL